MIIVRSPLRISLGGGGTDLPSYYEHHGGFVLSAAIDKYVYITLNNSWSKEFLLKYSEFERVADVNSIRHPIFRAALGMLNCTSPNLELVSIADIPAGTGLGSSASFTTALLKAIHVYQRNLTISAHDLAEQACRIEMDILKEPVGKQDQYIAAHGGITCLDIDNHGFVRTNPARISPATLNSLEDNLTMFFTCYSRSAYDLLGDQDQKTRGNDPDMIRNLHRVKELGLRINEALTEGQVQELGTLMHEHWQLKKTRSKGMSNTFIDELYELGRKNGAVGGKLVGAGGGGFLLFYTEDRRRLREAMIGAGLEELRFRFDFEGTKTLCS